jgi:hypothetical protein
VGGSLLRGAGEPMEASKELFRDWVLEAARNMPRDLVKVVLDGHNGATTRAAVAPLVEQIGRLATVLNRPHQVRWPSTPGLEVQAEAVIDAITPAVERIRTIFFGDAVPPFGTYQPGAEKVVVKRFMPENASRGPAGPAHPDIEQFERECKKLAMLVGSSVADIAAYVFWGTPPKIPPVTIERGTVLIPSKWWFSQWYATLDAPFEPPPDPDQIEREFEAPAAPGTSGEASAPTMKVPPVPGRLDPRVPRVVRRFAVLTINAQDLSERQWRALYPELRAQLGLARKKQLTAQHVRLWSLVRALGGRPASGESTAAFCRRVWREGKRRRLWTYEGYMPVYMAYRRLRKYLEGASVPKELLIRDRATLSSAPSRLTSRPRRRRARARSR